MIFDIDNKVWHPHFGYGVVSDSNHEHKRLCVIFGGRLAVVCSIYNLEPIDDKQAINIAP